MVERVKFQGFIGTSPAIQEVYDRLSCIGPSNARVLITGQTGTGKELAARALHNLGPRSAAPFVAINAAALPPQLMESELFGHSRGAFTGAHRDYAGLIAQAQGGTLFLDEIAELDLSLQAKLLRFLESGKYRRVGGTGDETSDIRIICATHKNLKTENFREDLYWRLHVIGLTLPPLIARGDDIFLLAKHFIEKFSALEKKSFCGFSKEALSLLRHHDYPGNVRELENIIHRAIVLNDGPLITAEMLDISATNNVVTFKNHPARPRPLWQIEEEAIQSALVWAKGNIPQAARLLEVNPSTLYRRKTEAYQGSIKELEKT